MGCLTPGRITPMRTVPSHIVRPEYVGKPTANEGNDSNMYTPEEVERVRAAGKIAAGAIVEASKICVPGTTTDEAQRIKELEKEVRELRRANAILKSASAFFAAELDRPSR